MQHAVARPRPMGLQFFCLCFLGPPARQCVAAANNDMVEQSSAESAAAPRKVVDVDDDEGQEEEDEREEVGEGEEEEEEEGDGEGCFCLGQEHDITALRDLEGSEWPADE